MSTAQIIITNFVFSAANLVNLSPELGSTPVPLVDGFTSFAPSGILSPF